MNLEDWVMCRWGWGEDGIDGFGAGERGTAEGDLF